MIHKMGIFCIAIVLFLDACALRNLSKLDESTEALNLNNQFLGVFPREILEGNKQLKILRLFQNSLTEIPDDIDRLENLEELYLGKNKLTRLPETLCNLKKLKILSVQYNDLESLPENLGDLENLEQLIVNQNQLKYLPESIGKLKKLQSIQVNFNKLEELPISLYDCHNLRFIRIGRNEITEISPQIEKLKQLKELSMVQAGRLLNLPETMCNLRRMELLEIDLGIVVPTCLLVMQTTRLEIKVY